jgi:hypothetical protein
VRGSGGGSLLETAVDLASIQGDLGTVPSRRGAGGATSSSPRTSSVMLCHWGPYSFLAMASTVLVLPVPGGP